MAEANQNPNKLFAVYLGGRAPRCNTELHDVVFIVGESIETSYERILDKWFGDPLQMHIDSWVELRCVDGYRISVQSSTSTSSKKLYFINLGAYLPGKFTELHANAFMVAEGEVEVKKRAKGELLRGTQSVHTDDLYDVDDCLEIAEVDGQHVHLELTSEPAVFEAHSSYHIVPKEAAEVFMARRAGADGKSRS
ncbi:MAG TPA: DUF1543 domain-containing protein [Verrucomicrobiae bacterium]|jgi:hypothetical protein